jgi:rare lipoprotein A
MASIQRGVLLALVVALCQPLIIFSPHPLYAEDKSDTTLKDDSARAEEVTDAREGIASYYAKRYHGRRTYSGARYHPDKLTAASPDHPMGTKLKVINLDNGREVLVTVNDRCRKRNFPFIDLSRAAAKKLGFLGRGTAKVIISLFKGNDKIETVAQGTVE